MGGALGKKKKNKEGSSTASFSKKTLKGDRGDKKVEKEKVEKEKEKEKNQEKQEVPSDDLPAEEPEKDDQEDPVEDGDAIGEEEDWEEGMVYGQDDKKVCVDDFDFLTVVGKGSFGKVIQVKKKDDGHIYAMKSLRKEAIIKRKQVDHTRAEKNILQKIQHPFIVQLHYAFQTEDKLYMILEYVYGGELFFHLKSSGRFTAARSKFYAASLTLVLAHLHSFDIVYRDLKPENILIDESGFIKVTDFGLSKELVDPEEGTQTFCGTPEYIAPEVVKGQKHNKAVDWWSLGTLLFEMLAGLPPFYSEDVPEMYQNILSGKISFPPHINGATKDIIRGLLEQDPAKRLGSGPNGSENVKNHPYFADVDWVALERKEVSPPYKPKVSNEMDTSHIDPVFTSEVACDSVVEKSVLDEAPNQFDGFTYVAQSELALVP